MTILHSGTPCFFGDWWGRPMDNCCRPAAAMLRGDTIVITFDQGERCAIEGAEGVENTPALFRVSAARRVIFEWYSDPDRRRGLCRRLYTFEDPRTVLLETAGPIGERRRRFDPQGAPAMVLA